MRWFDCVCMKRHRNSCEVSPFESKLTFVINCYGPWTICCWISKNKNFSKMCSQSNLQSQWAITSCRRAQQNLGLIVIPMFISSHSVRYWNWDRALKLPSAPIFCQYEPTCQSLGIPILEKQSSHRLPFQLSIFNESCSLGHSSLVVIIRLNCYGLLK